MGLAGAGGPSKFIRSSGSVVANPQRDSSLVVALTRDGVGSPALVADGGVVSSDPSIATASMSDHEISVLLSGKLGNTYLTTYDAAGNATAKVMVLAAVPSDGTLWM